MALEHGLQGLAADAPEAVDTDAGGHEIEAPCCDWIDPVA
jgi:hypothetical protein